MVFGLGPFRGRSLKTWLFMAATLVGGAKRQREGSKWRNSTNLDVCFMFDNVNYDVCVVDCRFMRLAIVSFYVESSVRYFVVLISNVP